VKKLFLCAILAQIPLSLLAIDVSDLEAKATHGDAKSAYELAKYYETQNEI
jgi:phospholipase A1